MNQPTPNPRSALDPAVPAQPAATAPPSIPDYELIRRIGGGAYGEVWLARSATGVFRALKIVYRRTFDDDRPYLREFQGIQHFERISRGHPGQLALFHVGRGEGYFYYVMELADDANAEGETRNAKSSVTEFSVVPRSAFRTPHSYSPHTLRADLGQGRLPAQKVLELGLALAEALKHLHAHGLVHRDVKPSNIIFVNGRPKLADIGLVTDASDTCSIVGTEGYLPPEGPGTPQADLFALGKVLYEALTGLDRRTFPKLPEDLRSWPDANQIFELNEIILKACELNVRERYESAEGIRVDLERLAGGKSVRRSRQVERGWRLVKHAAALLAAAATVVALAVLASRSRETSIAPNVEKRSTNEVANRFFDLGKTHFDIFTETNFTVAADYFQRAIQADTNFAQAYAYLAVTYSWSDDGWNPGWKLLPQAKETALQALKLDTSLAEPHLALAVYHSLHEWDWGDAESENKRALRLNSSASIGHLCYAEFLRIVGRTDEALEQINQAKNLDPHSRIINIRLAAYLADARRFDESLAQIDHVIAMGPTRYAFYVQQYTLLALGRYSEAIEAYRKFRIFPGKSNDQLDLELGELQRAVDATGSKSYWLWEVENQKKMKWNENYGQACAYIRLGQTNEAFNCLEKAVKERDPNLTFCVMTDWKVDPVRSDPRFRAILNAMGLKEH